LLLRLAVEGIFAVSEIEPDPCCAAMLEVMMETAPHKKATIRRIRIPWER